MSKTCKFGKDADTGGGGVPERGERLHGGGGGQAEERA